MSFVPHIDETNNSNPTLFCISIWCYTIEFKRKRFPEPGTTEEKPQHLKKRLKSTSLITECNRPAVPETWDRKNTSLQFVDTTTTSGVPGSLEHRHPRTRLSGQRFGHRSRRAGRLPLPRRARLPSAPPPLSLFPKPPPSPVPAGGRSGPGAGVRPPARARDGGLRGGGRRGGCCRARRVLGGWPGRWARALQRCREPCLRSPSVELTPFWGALCGPRVTQVLLDLPRPQTARRFVSIAPGYPHFQRQTGQDGLGCTGGAFPGHRDVVLAPKPTDGMTGGLSAVPGVSKEGAQGGEAGYCPNRASGIGSYSEECSLLLPSKTQELQLVPSGAGAGADHVPRAAGGSGAGTRTAAAVLQVTQTRTAFLPKQSVLLSRVPLRALPVRVPDPAASQLLGFCREPASDRGQTRRWLSAAMFPRCGSCRRSAACALAAPRGSAACRARGLLARGAAGVGAAVARRNWLTPWLLPALSDEAVGFYWRRG
ncbi:uncharacterized protein ACIBXB_011825 [Morphnus guianensis]